MRDFILKLINRLFGSLGLMVVDKGMASRLEQMEAKQQSYQNDYNALKEQIKNVAKYQLKKSWHFTDLLEDVMPISAELTCALCKYTAAKQDFTILESECIFYGGRLTRYQCPSCDVIFGPTKILRLDSSLLELEYKNHYQVFSEADCTAMEIRTFYALQPRRDGRYLNFGCGSEWSQTIQQLRKEGWDVVGFEPNAENKSEYVYQTWEDLEIEKFDGIFSNNVLEHLFDPIGILIRLQNLLKSGGRQAHCTPCFEYSFEYTRFHVFFFTGRSAEFMFDRAGLEAEQWIRDGDYIACILKAK